MNRNEVAVNTHFIQMPEAEQLNQAKELRRCRIMTGVKSLLRSKPLNERYRFKCQDPSLPQPVPDILLGSKIGAIPIDLPPRYNEVRAALPVDEVAYGCGGLKLFSADEIEQGQVGYSVAPDGKSLCSGDRGAWQPNWTVIGNETACGDPLFIDTDDSALPVLTAIHGEGSWEPQPVAISFDAFVRSLEEFVRISEGRSNPVECANNPLSEAERDSFLRRVAQLNGTQFEPDFWAVLLES